MNATAGKFAMKAAKRCSAWRAREDCCSAAQRISTERRHCQMWKDTKMMPPAASCLFEPAVARHTIAARQTAAPPRPICDQVIPKHLIVLIADFSRIGPSEKLARIDLGPFDLIRFRSDQNLFFYFFLDSITYLCIG
jgi:hypothetical protein